MAMKNQMFAFVAGEVSEAFYGRRDLAKYPLAVAEAENFYVDYHGGLLNRPGSEFIAGMRNEVHSLQKFRLSGNDLVLYFTDGKMRVLVNGQFILDPAGPSEIVVDEVGHATDAGSPEWPSIVAGQLLQCELAGETFYAWTDAWDGTEGTLSTVYPRPLAGTMIVTPVLEVATGITAASLVKTKFFQDLDTIVATNNDQPAVFIKRVADDDWDVSNFSNVLPNAPGSVGATPSSTGGASVGFVVTAVVDGIESAASAQATITNSVNYTTTTGHATVTWAAVAGASHYNVYRTLVFPAAFPAGATLGYLGMTNGLSFVDTNITPDFTKSPPFPVDFFSGGNFPSLYSRFQQRGVYAGLANAPLDVVSSIANDRRRFAATFPPIATDSYQYTLDAQTLEPIKHMLPLRYGLMLFTEDGVWQLKGGGESYALSATSAIAEHQGSVSVSDLPPIAINLDILFMTSLYSELIAMIYTEYVNSFKMQDILVLASHLFSADNIPVRMEWAAEPRKLIHFVKEDGQRATLTYERVQEVYGWSRARTQGHYVDIVAVKEDRYNLCYQTVRREVNGVEILYLERERPRHSTDLTQMWFADCALQTLREMPEGDLILERMSDDPYGDWRVTFPIAFTWPSDHRLYAAGGTFSLNRNEGGVLIFRPLDPPDVSKLYDKWRLSVKEGKWSIAPLTSSVSGLWHLEGRSVCVLADGDVHMDLVVEDGGVSFPGEAGCVLVGLQYVSRMKSLPLGLDGYILGGTPMTVRGIALRQMDSRGLAVGRNYSDLEELPSRRDEYWGNPLKAFNELTVLDTFGSEGWDVEAFICVEQKYPLPGGILGITYDLDVGE